jgi:hypothetical protein
VKRSEIQVYFFALFAFFTFFRFFSLFFAFFRFFRFASIFSLFAYFTFVFTSDFWCFASKWIMWNQAFFHFQVKRNFRFNFKFRFRSESEGAPYSLVLLRYQDLGNQIKLPSIDVHALRSSLQVACKQFVCITDYYKYQPRNTFINSFRPCWAAGYQWFIWETESFFLKRSQVLWIHPFNKVAAFAFNVKNNFLKL